MITPEQLSTEISTDPAGLGYAAFVSASNWGKIAEILTTPSLSYTKTIAKVPIASVLIWAASGPLDELYVGVSNTNPQIRSICRACIAIFSSPSTQYLDLGDTRLTTMLGNLVAAGVLTSADQTTCLALTQISPASRAEVIGGDGTTVDYFAVKLAVTGT
jgi:hypothetical protein